MSPLFINKKFTQLPTFNILTLYYYYTDHMGHNEINGNLEGGTQMAQKEQRQWLKNMLGGPKAKNE